MTEDRAANARREKEPVIRELVEKAGLTYPVPRIYIRAFKHERLLSIWGTTKSGTVYKHIQSYKVEGASGTYGPKLIEGDKQVPEGFYHIDRFNPFSRFLLSLGLNYPNPRDRFRSDKSRPGGDIFIHGSNLSIGCLAMTDDKIKEIYTLAMDAKNAGQTRIPVHIFPATAKNWDTVRSGLSPAYQAYMDELKPMLTTFDAKKKLMKVSVDPKTGRYKLS